MAAPDSTWKKFIIKVKYENSSDTERDTESGQSVFYFCRTCPSFRASTKESADRHLSQFHQLDSSTLLDENSTSAEACDNIFKKACLILSDLKAQCSCPESNPLEESCPSDVQSNSLSPVSSGSLASATPSPTAPSSPTSPISKELLSSCRKHITVTLNASSDTCAVTTRAIPPHDAYKTVNIKSVPRSIYACTECRVHFEHFDMFKAHQAAHHSSNSGRVTFSVSSSVTGTGVDPAAFHCNRCNRAFSSEQACELHSRKHRRRLQCELCPLTFCWLPSLKRHMIKVHNVRPTTLRIEDLKTKAANSNLSTGPNPLSNNTNPTFVVSKSRRGRPRRSSEWLLNTIERELKVNTALTPNPASTPLFTDTTLGVDTKYRMILPRPTSVGTSSSPKPLNISHPMRSRRRGARKRSELKIQSGVFSPLLCDTLARQSRSSFSPGLPHQRVIHTLDRAAVNPVELAVSDVVGVDRSDPTKPPPAHVLTVAAAYASQLPITACQEVAAVCDATASELPPDGTSADAVSVADTSTQSVPSNAVVSAVQIYPSSWIHPCSIQSTFPITSAVELTSTSAPAIDDDRGAVDLDCPDTNLPPQQPTLQLYPVLGPDGQTTMYYLAATSVDGVVSEGGSDNFYPQYAGQHILWLPECSATDSVHVQLPETCDPSTSVTNTASSTLPETVTYELYDQSTAAVTSTELVEPTEVIDLNALCYPVSSDRSEPDDGPTYYDISPPASTHEALDAQRSRDNSSAASSPEASSVPDDKQYNNTNPQEGTSVDESTIPQHSSVTTSDNASTRIHTDSTYNQAVHPETVFTDPKSPGEVE